MNRRKTPQDFDRLLEYLKDARGFDFSAYKSATMSRRIEKRMGTIGVKSYSDYIDFLEVHPNEFAELFNVILINVTAFFRDPETFEYIRNTIIPDVVSTKQPDDPIRVWSAGCASGEEAYSIAILLSESLGPQAYRDRVKIYGTDIDEDALSAA